MSVTPPFDLPDGFDARRGVRPQLEVHMSNEPDADTQRADELMQQAVRDDEGEAIEPIPSVERARAAREKLDAGRDELTRYTTVTVDITQIVSTPPKAARATRQLGYVSVRIPEGDLEGYVSQVREAAEHFPIVRIHKTDPQDTLADVQAVTDRATEMLRQAYRLRTAARTLVATVDHYGGLSRAATSLALRAAIEELREILLEE